MLRNFVPIRFKTMEPKAFMKRWPHREQNKKYVYMISNMGSAPDPKFSWYIRGGSSCILIGPADFPPPMGEVWFLGLGG